jgi:hypothetical protein
MVVWCSLLASYLLLCLEATILATSLDARKNKEILQSEQPATSSLMNESLALGKKTALVSCAK